MWGFKMKNVIGVLSVILLLSSACSKNFASNNTKSNVTSENSTSSSKLDIDSRILGSFTVEKLVAKTNQGDYTITFPGLVETREISVSGNKYVIKQKAIYKGCTRETVSDINISLQTGTYTRQPFKSEVCQGTCPQVLTGRFEGHQSYAAPDEPMGCNNGNDDVENGTVSFENGRLIFVYIDEVSKAGLVETNLKN
jgi:hypothetical protein